MWFWVVLLTQIVVGSTERCDECTCVSGKLETEETDLSVSEAFQIYNITPDYVPVAPKDFLEVNYVTASANLGNFIPPLRLVDPKTIRYNKGKKDGYYTLMSLDLDSEENGKAFIVLINIRDVETIVPSSGDVIVPFSPPLPPLGSGVHRHTKLLYEQKGPIDPDRPELLKLSRDSAIPNLSKLTKSLHLGDPVAGNLYRTELRRCDEEWWNDKTDDFKQCEKICKILSS